MQLASLIAAMFSLLVPAKIWVPANQPLMITVQTQVPVNLVLTEFGGRIVEAKGPKGAAEFDKPTEVDLRQLFTALNNPGTYVLWAVPRDNENKDEIAYKRLPEFVGTPLVLSVRNDSRPANPTPDEILVTKIEPLRYGVITTDKGAISFVFYYDVAPDTSDAIMALAGEGFYDGLTFHRIVPGFVIQGGDPLGDGRGSPGFNIAAEFSSRKHLAGVLSMARNGDPLENQGFKPRPEFANSAGSQFFICLEAQESLDGKYTAFGKVTDGMDVVKAIGAVPLADAKSGKPQRPPVIQKFEIKRVEPGNNPYTQIMVFNQ
jgi:peptidyl-prolyl cis-trans isomerase B (cyclophilin B)